MLGYRIVKRQSALRGGEITILLGGLSFAFTVCGFLLLVQDKPPLECFRLLFEGGFGSGLSLEDTLLKTIPIFLCSLGVAIAFRMQIWNIGAEGQFALGAVGATWAVLTFPDLPMLFMLPTILVCAAVAGGVWGFIPGLLRLKCGLNEIISTLMMNYIGILFLQYLIYGSWKASGSYGFPMTEIFPDSAILPPVFGRIHVGILLCVLAAVLLGVFLRHTRLGFEILVGGENPRAAQYARMPYGFLVVLVMALSGALAGIAGCVEVSATFNRLQPDIATGYGYTAIVVAWLSRLKITSIALFSFLLAGLRVGVENLQLLMQIPVAFGGILEGLILLAVLAGQCFHTYTVQRTTLANDPHSN
ncbi:MAG: ABC transporter permease [Bilophila sp.]